jgi:hypothetical protein
MRIRFMPPFRPSIRHLYLLALFQLVGGPLVILAVVFFSRMVVHQAAEHGLTVGVVKASQSAEWQKVASALSGATYGHPSNGQKDPVPVVKDPGGKLIGLMWEGITLPEEQPVPCEGPYLWVRTLTSDWPHAPPLPPPRCA